MQLVIYLINAHEKLKNFQKENIWTIEILKF
jgi:hypothetical protein